MAVAIAGNFAGDSPAPFYIAMIMPDDKEAAGKEMYRVTLFHKGDFEVQLNKTLEVLTAAGAYINSVDAETKENDTGYWIVPITIELLKE